MEDVKFIRKNQKPIQHTDIIFKNLGTSEAYRFPYLNLIASNNPYEFMKYNYADLVADVNKKIISLDKLQLEYEKKLTLWQNEYDSLEKKIKNQDVLSKKQSELLDLKPSLIYPEECQINTKMHVSKYSRHAIPTFNNKFRIPITLDNINLDNMHITDDTKINLLSGICCYGNPESIELDEDYLATSLDLTSNKKIESIIADSSICYGTDYPIGGVIITPEFAEKHSLNTIYQLMSRAGRGRKSSNAEIYINNTCAEKILNTVKLGNKFISSEIENMLTIFTNIIL
jgi:hypothetical protein